MGGLLSSGVLAVQAAGCIEMDWWLRVIHHSLYSQVTNEKKLYYYGDLECKGVVDLSKMRQCGTEDANDKEFFIDTKDRKWELEVMDEELLQHTKTENETTESVQNAVKWYEDLENTRNIIDILLAKWPRGTVCPPGVVKARADLQTFMDDSAGVIMEDIKAYSNENISDFTVLRLHRACCLMSDLDGGQMMVSKYIEELLLSRAETTFAAGGSYSDLKNIQRRFAEYERQMRDYDKKFRPFIPKWWCLVCVVSISLIGVQSFP